MPGCTYMFGRAFLSMMKPEAGEFDLDLMPDLPALFQPGDLAVGDLPLLQPLGCGIQQRLGSVSIPAVARSSFATM